MKNLTQVQTKSIERLQVVGVKIILGKDCPIKENGHFDYEEALRICSLDSLFSRRQKGMFQFGKKCVKHPSLNRHFPLIQAVLEDPHNVRTR